MNKSPFWRDRAMLTIVCAAVLIRILYVSLYPQLPLISDAAAYAAIGSNLAAGNGYTTDGSIPDTYWPPGYPLFLAALFRIFGEELLAVRIAQAVLGGMLVLMTFFFAEKLFDRDIAAMASGIAALYPGLVLYSGMILTETLYATLFLAMMVLLRRTWSGALMAVIGALVGFGTLVRKELVAFPFFVLGMVAVVLFLERRRSHARRVRIALLPKLALLLSGMAIVLAPWVARNYAITDTFTLVSAHSGDALWLSTYPEDWQEWRPLPPELQKQLEGLTPVGRDAVFRRAALENLREHPLAYLQMSGKRFIRFWVGSHTGALQGFTESFAQAFAAGHRVVLAVKALLLLLNTAVIGLGFFGAWMLVRGNAVSTMGKTLLLSPILFKMLLHTLTFSTSRYHIPIMPFMIILCAYGISILYRGVQPRWVDTLSIRDSGRMANSPSR